MEVQRASQEAGVGEVDVGGGMVVCSGYDWFGERDYPMLRMRLARHAVTLLETSWHNTHAYVGSDERNRCYCVCTWNTKTLMDLAGLISYM